MELENVKYEIKSEQEEKEKINQLIAEENLNEKAYRFIEKLISKGFVEYTGDELDGIIPPLSRRGGVREKKKEIVLEKLRKIVDVFVGV